MLQDISCWLVLYARSSKPSLPDDLIHGALARLLFKLSSKIYALALWGAEGLPGNCHQAKNAAHQQLS